MQTSIRVRLSELNSSFLEKLKVAMIQLSSKTDPEIEIVLNESEYDPAFVDLILKSSNELQNGRKHVFTMDSLVEFSKS